MDPLDPLLRRAADADDSRTSDFGSSAPSSSVARTSWWKRSRQKTRIVDDVDDDGLCCACCETKLSHGERLFGCFICFLGGHLLSFGSLIRFAWLIEGNPLPFVAIWTLGHFFSLCGSTFLVGPRNQIKRMFDPTRANASIAYLSSMAVTLAIVLLCIIFDRPTGLALGFVLVLLLVIEGLSIAWYTLSYVPFLQNYLTKLLFSDGKTGSTSTSASTEFGIGARKKNFYEELL